MQQKDDQDLGAYRPLEDDAESEGSDGAPPPSDIPPRGLGDLIGESFNVYGQAFAPLIIIALVSQVPNIVGIAFEDAASTLVLTLLAFLIAIPSAAAAAFCVGSVLAGRKPDVVTCYARAIGVFIPAAIVTVVVTVALVVSGVLMVIIIGIPLFFYLLVVWFFAMPAVVIEGKDGIAALGRSRELTRGSWWRLFGIGVTYAAIALAVMLPAWIVLGIVSIITDSVTPLVIGVTVAAILLIPLYYAGTVLVYVDLRVRNEGYDMRALADDLARRPGQTTP